MNPINRKTIALITLFLALTTVMSACGVQQTDSSAATPDSVQVKDSGNLHTLYFKDGGKSEKVVATFLNSASGESEEVEMTKCGEDSDSRTFSCEDDVRKYNVASFDCNGQKTRKVAFDPCVSGWYKSKNGWMPYTQGKEMAYVPSSSLTATATKRKSISGRPTAMTQIPMKSTPQSMCSTDRER